MDLVLFYFNLNRGQWHEHILSMFAWFCGAPFSERIYRTIPFYFIHSAVGLIQANANFIFIQMRIEQQQQQQQKKKKEKKEYSY